jgi:hypothetical protein
MQTDSNNVVNIFGADLVMSKKIRPGEQLENVDGYKAQFGGILKDFRWNIGEMNPS